MITFVVYVLSTILPFDRNDRYGRMAALLRHATVGVVFFTPFADADG
ncbi:MAG: hypothetical protein OXR64_08640 [Chloroflexota bacterium]|nr:hypothetical protein [Chloroflexota bacterium]MDE2919899.1 hypothetical protein [Chloroflexota bacterium]